MTQHPQNNPISYSLQTIDKNELMHNNDHITIKSTAITHTHHPPQDPKIYNKDTTRSKITHTPSLMQENNSISQSCSNTSSQDIIKTKSQHFFNWWQIGKQTIRRSNVRYPHYKIRRKRAIVRQRRCLASMSIESLSYRQRCVRPSRSASSSRSTRSSSSRSSIIARMTSRVRVPI